MLELCLKAYVTNVPELLSGLNLVRKTNLEFVGTKLAPKKGTKMLPIATLDEEVGAYDVKLNSLFKDDFAMTGFPHTSDILVQAKDGLMFIGRAALCATLASTLMVGKVGIVADRIEASVFYRGFWSVDAYDADFIDRIAAKVKEILNKENAPEEPAAEPESESEPEKPAEEPAKPADDGGAKPVKPKTEKPKPESKPEEPAKKSDDPAPAEESAESACTEEPRKDAKCLADLINGTTTAGIDFAAAERECREMCKREGIRYDIDRVGV